MFIDFLQPTRTIENIFFCFNVCHGLKKIYFVIKEPLRALSFVNIWRTMSSMQ